MKRQFIFITVVSVAVLVIGGNVMHNMDANRIEAAAQAAKAEELRLVQEKHNALIAEFQANRGALVSDAQRLIAHDEPVAAQALLAKFATLKDPDVAHLIGVAARNIDRTRNIKQLSDELATKPALARSMAIYKELLHLEPANPLWRAMIEEIQPAFAEMERRDAELQRSGARKEAVKRLFSAWDGSVRSVEEAIKVRLKDPDSYKHVETRFQDPGVGNLTVVTQYRARNSFNAVITDVATAVVSPTGELVSISLKN